MNQVVWVTRHGNREDFVNPDWRKTAERPFDPALSPDGFVQAQKTGERLVGEGITHIFASPFLRTVQTANEIADVLDKRIYLEPGLAEWMNPDWFPGVPEMLSYETLAQMYPRIDLKYTPFGEFTYPETVDDALERAGRTAHRLAGAYPGTILLVGHGVSVTGAVEGLDPDLEILECALCSIFKLIKNENGWETELRGDISHLGHAQEAKRFI